jgi:transcriptional regulator with XRE-family HTH domain
MGHARLLRVEIGNRLRELRRAAGVPSQEKLAELAGVHRTYVGRLERGESGVTVDALSTILAAMSISLAEFFRPFDRPRRVRTPRKRG